MFPPFPEAEAEQICRGMIAQLQDGSLRMEQLSAVSEERGNHGLMLGALVCTDAAGQRVVLKTLSGTSRTLCPAAGQCEAGSIFVPPLAAPAAINAALAKNDAQIHLLTEKIRTIIRQKKDAIIRQEKDAITRQKKDASQAESEELRSLKAERSLLTTESLAAVHALYAFHCADGKQRPLLEICRERCGGTLPPTGTGDCCAPKLLDYAFSHGLQPQSMCEVFYGEASTRRSQGERCPPCDERCGIVLPAMLGLEILYRDSDIIVVNKQSGLLSVPGRGPDKQDCIVNRVRRLFPQCIAQPAVHRLDMETSGLLVLAFTKEAHRELNRQFEAGEVRKQYIALLDGVLAQKGIPAHGQSELYFRLDVEHRPHQIWDAEHGKKAVTEWQVLNVERYHAPDGSIRNATRVLFTPHTGRTHQLRLASADAHGFGVPIIGDTLYGHCAPGERLMLHAQYLSFTHPADGRRMEFTCQSPF